MCIYSLEMVSSNLYIVYLDHKYLCRLGKCSDPNTSSFRHVISKASKSARYRHKTNQRAEQKQYSGWRRDRGWRDKPTSLPNWTFHFREEKKNVLPLFRSFYYAS